MPIPPFKTCPCCQKSYTAEAWAALPVKGVQTSKDEEGTYELTLKNCYCGSTIGVEVKTATIYNVRYAPMDHPLHAVDAPCEKCGPTSLKVGPAAGERPVGFAGLSEITLQWPEPRWMTTAEFDALNNAVCWEHGNLQKDQQGKFLPCAWPDCGAPSASKCWVVQAKFPPIETVWERRSAVVVATEERLYWWELGSWTCLTRP